MTAPDALHPRPLHPRHRPLAAIAALAAAALLATGCGGDGDQEASEQPLGMDQDAACVTYGTELAPAEIEELAGGVRDTLDRAPRVGDPDEVDLAGYEGERDAAEALALHRLVERAVVEHAAGDSDVTDDDVDEELEGVAAEAGLDDADELVAAIADGTGFTEDQVRDLARTDLLAERAFAELEEADAGDLADADEWVDDVLLAEASGSDEVRCAEELGWEADLGDDLVLPEGEEVSFGEVVEQLTVEAVDEAAAPDPQEIANRYDADVAPVLEDFLPLFSRFVSAFTKLDSGQIDGSRMAEAMERQVGAAQALQRRASAADTGGDQALVRANEHLVAGLAAYEDMLVAMRDLLRGDLSAEQRATDALARFERELTAWSEAIDSDERLFGRISRAGIELEDQFERLASSVG